jgi:hypothetical protein
MGAETPLPVFFLYPAPPCSEHPLLTALSDLAMRVLLLCVPGASACIIIQTPFPLQPPYWAISLWEARLVASQSYEMTSLFIYKRLDKEPGIRVSQNNH